MPTPFLKSARRSVSPVPARSKPVPAPPAAQPMSTRTAKIHSNGKTLLARAQRDIIALEFGALPATLAIANDAVAKLPKDSAWREGMLIDIEFTQLLAHFIQADTCFQSTADRLLQRAQAHMQAAQASNRVAQVWALKSYAHGCDMQFTEQKACASQAMHLADRNNHLAHFWAHLGLAVSLNWMGDFGQTSAHFQPALAHAREGGDLVWLTVCTQHMAQMQANEACYLWESMGASLAALNQAEADLHACIALQHELAPNAKITQAHLYLADVWRAQGKSDEALAMYGKCLEGLRQHELSAPSTASKIAKAVSGSARCLLNLACADEAQKASLQAVAGLLHVVDPAVQASVYADSELVLRAAGLHTAADGARQFSDQAMHKVAAWKASHRVAFLGTLPVAQLA
jgi:tetratricopeptide (TPR) repeat protein